MNGPTTFSYPMYKDFRDRNEVFSGLIARCPTSISFTYKGQTERLQAEMVSGNYFDTLGVRAARGRLLTQQDDHTVGGHPVAVLSHSLWQKKLGAATKSSIKRCRLTATQC